MTLPREPPRVFGARSFANRRSCVDYRCTVEDPEDLSVRSELSAELSGTQLSQELLGVCLLEPRPRQAICPLEERCLLPEEKQRSLFEETGKVIQYFSLDLLESARFHSGQFSTLNFCRSPQ